MLIPLNITLHVGVFLALVLLGGYGILDFLFIATSLIATGVAAHVALRKARSGKENARGALLIGIILFFWIVYTVKLVIALYAVHDFWVVSRLIDAERLYAVLPEAFALASLGYLSLVAAVLSFPLSYRIDWTVMPCRARSNTILTIAGIGLGVKYVLKSVFLLGIPSVEPISMGIPFLTGIMTLVIGDGFLFLVNIPVFLALVNGRRWYLAVALTAAFANAGIDLAFGTKNTLLLQLVLVPIYLAILSLALETGRSRFRKTARSLMFGVGLIGLLTLAVYKYLNFIRFALLSETTDIKRAVAIAALNENAQSRSSVMDIVNRLTGLETLGAVMHLKVQIQVQNSLMAFIDGSVVRQFTQIVLGSIETRTLFSVTQFGYFHILGGPLAVVFGSLAIGFLFSFIQYFCFRTIPVHHNMKLVFLPILWLSFVSLLLGGGNLILWGKDVVVTLALYFVIARIAVRYGRQATAGRDDHGRIDAAVRT